MQIPNISKRERKILIICVSVISASLIYNFVLEPLVAKWTDLDSRIEASGLRLRKGREIIKRRQEIAEQYKDIASFVTEQSASDEEEIALLLGEVEKLANVSGAHITDIKPRPVKEEGFYKRYVVEVESEGDISRFSKFIFEIQNSPKILKIEKLSIGMTRGGSDQLKATMIISKFLP